MAWLHTEIVDTVGPLEYVLNTPSHHRVHHSRNPEYIDKNYGGMLIIWDRLFGTFKQEDKNNPPVYGLVHQVQSFDPIYIQFHPWRIIWRRIKRAKGIGNKLKVVFYGPGWKPGLGRLGNPEDLPKVFRPVNLYDPQISPWLNTYVVVHFAMLLLFYHELTLHQNHFSPWTLNYGVLVLLATITSLGLILDKKRRYDEVFEIARCIMFFAARRSIASIVMHGLERGGFNFPSRVLILTGIYIIFALSVLLMTISLIWKLMSQSHVLIKLVDEFNNQTTVVVNTTVFRDKRLLKKLV